MTTESKTAADKAELLTCVRCGHDESYHTEDDEEEDGETYCHFPMCLCSGFIID